MTNWSHNILMARVVNGVIMTILNIALIIIGSCLLNQSSLTPVSFLLILNNLAFICLRARAAYEVFKKHRNVGLVHWVMTSTCILLSVVLNIIVVCLASTPGGLGSYVSNKNSIFYSMLLIYFYYSIFMICLAGLLLCPCCLGACMGWCLFSAIEDDEEDLENGQIGANGVDPELLESITKVAIFRDFYEESRYASCNSDNDDLSATLGIKDESPIDSPQESVDECLSLSHKEQLSDNENLDHHHEKLVLEPNKEAQEISEIDREISQSSSSHELGCSICTDPFRPDDLIRVLRCNHYYHKDCVDIWFRRSSACPYCNTNIN
jgi:hypothetical protein